MAVFTAITLISCTQNESKKPVEANSKQTETTEKPLFAKGNQGPKEFFTGTSYVNVVLDKDSVQNNYAIGEVTFEPGARSNWHDHPAGQVIMVTAGKGFVQERGKPAQEIKKGDLIVCQPNVDHWHGAAPDSEMSHITVTNYKDGKNVNRKTPVTDEEYQNATKQ